MGYQTLYRAYRAQTFDDLIGQAAITQTLKNSITSGRIPHALLFSGPRGTGKTSLARIFAKALNCRNGTPPTPCNQCDLCERITKGYAVDVIEMDAASNRGIDEIRALAERIQFAPVEATYKLYIIDEVHMLTHEAFNALLKTIEEPPPHAIFILATTEAQKVPVTITSRCQRFDFRRIRQNDIMTQLKKIATHENINIQENAYPLIAQHAEGSLRDAISLLDQLITYCEAEIKDEDVIALLGTSDCQTLFTMSAYLLRGEAAPLLDLLQQMEAEGNSIPKLTRDIIQHVRNLMVAKLSRELVEGTQALAKQYEEQAIHFALPALQTLLKKLIEVEGELKWHSSPRAILEMTLLETCLLQTPSQANSSRIPLEIPLETIAELPRENSQENAREQVAPKVTDQEIPREERAITKRDGNHQELTEQWAKILSTLQEKSFESFLLLQKGDRLECEENTLFITYEKGFSFYIAKLKEEVIQQTIQGAIQEHLGKSLQVMGREDEKSPTLKTDSETSDGGLSIKQIADLFSGQVLTT